MSMNTKICKVDKVHTPILRKPYIPQGSSWAHTPDDFLFDSYLRGVNVHEFIYKMPVRKDLQEITNKRQVNGLTALELRARQQAILARDKEYRTLLQRAKKNFLYSSKAKHQHQLVVNLVDEMYQEKAKPSENNHITKHIPQPLPTPTITRKIDPLTHAESVTLSQPPLLATPRSEISLESHIQTRVRSASLPLIDRIEIPPVRKRSVSVPLMRSPQTLKLELLIENIQLALKKWYEEVQRMEVSYLDAPILF